MIQIARRGWPTHSEGKGHEAQGEKATGRPHGARVRTAGLGLGLELGLFHGESESLDVTQGVPGGGGVGWEAAGLGVAGRGAGVASWGVVVG